MAKYLITGSYTAQGTKGLLVEGGSGRRAALQKALESVGGKLDAMYFAQGETDFVMIADVPDTASGVALGLVARASGTANSKSTQLVTVEEMDAACKMTVAFRPAGAAGV